MGDTTETRAKRSPFGRQLRKELDRQRVSIRGLARKMAPSNPDAMRRNIARWIGGYNEPTRLNRIAVAEALGLPDDTFLSDDEDGSRVRPLSPARQMNMFVDLLAEAVRTKMQDTADAAPANATKDRP